MLQQKSPRLAQDEWKEHPSKLKGQQSGDRYSSTDAKKLVLMAGQRDVWEIICSGKEPARSRAVGWFSSPASSESEEAKPVGTPLLWGRAGSCRWAGTAGTSAAGP